MEDRLPRKLTAILYADVAGYGQVMHYAGDAMLAKFDAVVDARYQIFLLLLVIPLPSTKESP